VATGPANTREREPMLVRPVLAVLVSGLEQ